MTSKVHIAVDGLGNPLRFILTGGQVGDVTQAEELIADVAGANLIADTAYDADHLRARLNDAGIVAVIPSTRHGRKPSPTMPNSTKKDISSNVT